MGVIEVKLLLVERKTETVLQKSTQTHQIVWGTVRKLLPIYFYLCGSNDVLINEFGLVKQKLNKV